MTSAIREFWMPMLCPLMLCGCIRTQQTFCLTPQDAEALETVRRQLVVLPVFTSVPVSGFPISSRNALCAAHAFQDWVDVAAVAGAPMFAVNDVKSLPPPERDRIVMYSTVDRFQPNVIDGSVPLRRGDRVFVAGYRSQSPPYDAIYHLNRSPEIIAGRVLAPEYTGDSGGVVEVEIPPGDYDGFSGGPAAILDDDGRVRVWGVLVRGGWALDRSIPWSLRFYTTVTRFSQAELERMQSQKFLNPAEIPLGPSKPPTEEASSGNRSH